MIILRKEHTAAIRCAPADNADFRLACERIVAHLSIDQLHFAFDRFGISRDVRLLPDECERFCAVASAMVTLNYDYSLAFRWLLWNPKDNILYENNDPVSVVEDLNTGYIHDVTNDERFEARFFKIH